MEKIQAWATCMIKECSKSFLFFGLLLFSVFAWADETDSLKKRALFLEKNQNSVADTQLAEAYHQLVSVYFNQLNLDSAFNYLTALDKEASRLKSLKYQSEAALFYTTYFTYKGNLDTAITLSERLIKTKGVSEKNIGIAYDNIAVAYYYKSEFLQALDYYLKALEIFEKVAPLETNYTYSNIANLYSAINDHEKAVEYFRKCIEVEQKIGDTVGVFVSYINFYNAFFKAEIFDSAEFYLEKAVEARKNVDVSFYDDVLLSHRGLQEQREGNLRKALTLLDSGRTLAKANQNFYAFCNSSSHMADVYIKLGNINAAKKTALQAYDLALEKGYVGVFRYLNKHLATIYEKQANFEKALTHHILFKQYSDSILNKKNIASIDRLRYLREKTEKESASAKAELAIKSKQLTEKELSTQTLINWVVGISAIVLLVLLFIVSRLSSRNKATLEKLRESQELLKSKSIELESYNTRLVELNKIKNRLVSLLAHDLRSPMVGIVSSINLIQEEAFSKDEVDEMLKEISSSASANLEGLDNLVKWTKTQMEGIERNVVETSAEEVYLELKKELRGLLKTKKITLRFDKTGKNKILVDYEMLKSSIRNLITNAIKFSDEGQEVSVTSEEKGEEVVIKVADRAGGIPKELHKSIFEGPITSSPGTKGEKGSGIGLMLVKEFISINGGNIHFETEEGVGTTFIVRFKKA